MGHEIMENFTNEFSYRHQAACQRNRLPLLLDYAVSRTNSEVGYWISWMFPAKTNEKTLRTNIYCNTVHNVRHPASVKPQTNK